MLRFMLVFGLVFTLHAQAFGFENNPQVSQLFAEQNINGTFVLYDVTHLTGHNRKRAETRYIPASTFKIPNSLIGLTTKAVSSVDEIFYQHDNTPKYLKSWEKDASLREAIKVSNVSAYQELARRIGLEQMRKQVEALNYGNGEIGNKVDQFWLKGPLKISAIEQAQFLARLAQDQLAFPPAIQKAVREICQLEINENWVLYGKTGLASGSPVSIGWFVGWIKYHDKIYSFALNMDIKDKSELPLRIELTKKALDILVIAKDI